MHLIFKGLLSKHIIYHLCPLVSEGSLPQKQTPERNSALENDSLSSFTHYQVVLNPYGFLSSNEHEKLIFEEHFSYCFPWMWTWTGISCLKISKQQKKKSKLYLIYIWYILIIFYIYILSLPKQYDWKKLKFKSLLFTDNFSLHPDHYNLICEWIIQIDLEYWINRLNEKASLKRWSKIRHPFFSHQSTKKR